MRAFLWLAGQFAACVRRYVAGDTGKVVLFNPGSHVACGEGRRAVKRGFAVAHQYNLHFSRFVRDNSLNVRCEVSVSRCALQHAL